MDKLYVLSTAGSLIDTDVGTSRDFVCVYLKGVPEPGAEQVELALVLQLEDAATLVYGLHRLAVEMGRGPDFRQMAVSTVLLDGRTQTDEA